MRGSAAGGSLLMNASSSGLTPGCTSGRRYVFSHTMSHARLKEPVTTNAARQPKARVIPGTISGVRIAPTFEPALNIPVANARSRCGNHSAIAFRPAGKFPDLPNPRANRNAVNPAIQDAHASAALEKVPRATHVS